MNTYRYALKIRIQDMRREMTYSIFKQVQSRFFVCVDFMAWNVTMTKNTEWEDYVQMIVACFKHCSKRFFGDSEENYEHICLWQAVSKHKLNPGHPENETRMLTQCSILKCYVSLF